MENYFATRHAFKKHTTLHFTRQILKGSRSPIFFPVGTPLSVFSVSITDDITLPGYLFPFFVFLCPHIRKPLFSFNLEIYNKCNEKASTQNIYRVRPNNTCKRARGDSSWKICERSMEINSSI